MVLFTPKLPSLYNLHWNLCRKPWRCHMPTNIRRSEYISYGKIKTRRYIECIERRLNVEKFYAATGLQNHRRIYATYCSAQISQSKHYHTPVWPDQPRLQNKPCSLSTTHLLIVWLCRKLRFYNCALVLIGWSLYILYENVWKAFTLQVYKNV